MMDALVFLQVEVEPVLPAAPGTGVSLQDEMFVLWIMVGLALLLSLLSLIVSYRGRSRRKPMADPAAAPTQFASASAFNDAGVSGELVRALRKHPMPPGPLSEDTTRALWSLVHHALASGTQTPLRPQQLASQIPQPPHAPPVQPAPAPRPAPAAPLAPSAPQPLAAAPVAQPQPLAQPAQVPETAPVPAPAPAPSLGAIDPADVAYRLMAQGQEGMRALGSRGDFARFQQEVDVTFFRLDETGLSFNPHERLPASQRWLFGLRDEATGLMGLFFGPAVRTQSARLSGDPIGTMERFSPWFTVETRGKSPELQSPAIVELRGDTVQLLAPGAMTL